MSGMMMRTRALFRRFVWTASAFVLFLLCWEIVGRYHLFGLSPSIMPPFTTVIARVNASKGILASHLSLTLWETLLGFGIALVAAAVLTATFDRIKPLKAALFPMLTAFQSVPKVALAPLLVIWLGHGMYPNVAMAALIAFFPLLVNFAAGLDSTREELELFMDGLAASWWQRFRKIRLPSAVPFVLSGCKVAITFALIGAIVGEFVNPSSGLGYIIATANENFDTSLQFAAIFVVSIIGWGLFQVFSIVELLLFSRFYQGTRAQEILLQI